MRSELACNSDRGIQPGAGCGFSTFFRTRLHRPPSRLVEVGDLGDGFVPGHAVVADGLAPFSNATAEPIHGCSSKAYVPLRSKRCTHELLTQTIWCRLAPRLACPFIRRLALIAKSQLLEEAAVFLTRGLC